MGGDREDLHRQLLLQLKRFVDGATRPMDGATVSNLGPGYRFHYLPQAPEAHKYNLDSAEYANIVCGFLVAYRQARDAGMPPLDRARAPRRARVDRARAVGLLDARRLPELGHRPRLQALAPGQEARAQPVGAARDRDVPGAVARSRRGPSTCSTAPSSSSTAGRSAAAGCRPRTPSTCPAIDDNESSALLTAARVQANAAQAALFGLGEMQGEEPPPLYAYDPDVGRLAVTTPAYNTAIVAVTRGAFPYGGIELARLFDREQDVAGGVGGRPPASFGVVVRRRRGDRARLPARAGAVGREPLRLLEAPRGATANPSPIRNRPYAGAFETLRVQGTSTRGGIEIRTTHTFKADLHRDRVARDRREGQAGRGAVPELGRRRKVTAVMKSGARKPVTNGMALSNVDHFHVESEHSGYVVTLRSGASGATALTRRPSAQSSAPKPGPDADAAGEGDDGHGPDRAGQDRGRGAGAGGGAAVSLRASSVREQGASRRRRRAAAASASRRGSTVGRSPSGRGLDGERRRASATGRRGHRRGRVGLRRLRAWPSGRAWPASAPASRCPWPAAACTSARGRASPAPPARASGPGCPAAVLRNLRSSSNISLAIGLARVACGRTCAWPGSAPVLVARDAGRRARAARLAFDARALLGARALRDRDARDRPSPGRRRAPERPGSASVAARLSRLRPQDGLGRDRHRDRRP